LKKPALENPHLTEANLKNPIPRNPVKKTPSQAQGRQGPDQARSAAHLPGKQQRRKVLPRDHEQPIKQQEKQKT
jgi:hypothetical protein